MKRLLFVSLALAACATPRSTRLTWLADAELRAPLASEYPDADAVTLFHEQKIQMVALREYSTRIQGHTALAILTEKGFRHASIRVPILGRTELLYLAARTIAPDGTVHEVPSSSIIEDTLRFGEHDLRYRVFAFPTVSVGSIIEYQFTLAAKDSLLTSDWELISSDTPVKRYLIELEGTGNVQCAMKAYNAAERIVREDTKTGWRFRWQAQDIPARLDEAYGPDIRRYEPWWAFRVTAVSAFVEKDAGDALRESMRRRRDGWYGMHQMAWLGEWKPKLELHEPCDAECKVNAVWEQLNRTVVLSDDPATHDRRNALAVAAAGVGNAHQRVSLLWKMLTDAGLDARYAIAERFGHGYVDDKFPMGDARDDVLLYLPQQAGLDRAIWLDPGCDWCGVGEVSDGLREVQAVVLHWTKIESVRVDAQAPIADKVLRDYRVRLDAKGGADATVSRQWTGTFARTRAGELRKERAAELERDDQEFIAARVSTAELRKPAARTCVPGQKTCADQLELAAAAWATADGDELIAPLSILRTPLDEEDFGRDRRLELVVRDSRVVEERATFEAPAGYAPSFVPASRKVSAPGLELEIEAHVDGAKVVVRRTARFIKGEWPIERFPEFAGAVREYGELRRQLVVFRKKP